MELSNSPSSRAYKILLGLAISLLCFAVYVAFISANATPDKEISFYTARAWLAGKKLYTDLFTVQPPLIYYIYAIPVYLSLHLGGLEDFQYLVLLGLPVVVCVTYAALKLIQFHPAFAADRKKQAEFCLLIVTVFISLQTPPYFLDREYIFLLLVFPYILRYMPSIAQAALSRRFRSVIAVMAAIGMCMKPYCLIVFAGIQCICFLRERSLAILVSLESVIISLLVAVYVWCVWWFTPEYITVVIPMALATYSASSRNRNAFLYAALAFLSGGTTFADFRLNYHSPYRKDIFYLLAVFPLFVVYALANHGWGYSWNLPISYIMIMTGFVFWEYQYLKKEHAEKNMPTRQFIFGMRACVISWLFNASIVLTEFLLVVNSCGYYYNCEEPKQFVSNFTVPGFVGPIKSFGTISIDFGTWPLLSRYTGATWETRFNHLWMLPKFFISDSIFEQRNQWIVNYVGRALAEDLERNKPQVVFVDDTENFYAAHTYVDLVAYLSRVPEFKEAWRHYSYVSKVPSIVSLQQPFTLFGQVKANNKLPAHDGHFVYRRTD